MYILSHGGKMLKTGSNLIINSQVSSFILQEAFIEILNPWGITLSYSKTVDSSSVPLNSDYEVLVDSQPNSVINISISENTVFLELETDLNSTEVVTLSYSGNAIKSLNGQIDPPYSNLQVNSYLVSESVGLSISTYDYSLNKVTIGYIPELDQNYVPSISAFTATDRNVINSEIISGDGVITVDPPCNKSELQSGLTSITYNRPRVDFYRDSKNAIPMSFFDETISYYITEPSMLTIDTTVNARLITIKYYTNNTGILFDTNYYPMSSFSVMDNRTGLPFANIVDMSTNSTIETDEYINLLLTIDVDATTTDNNNIHVDYVIPETNYFRYDTGFRVEEFSMAILVV